MIAEKGWRFRMGGSQKIRIEVSRKTETRSVEVKVSSAGSEI